MYVSIALMLCDGGVTDVVDTRQMLDDATISQRSAPSPTQLRTLPNTCTPDPLGIM